MMRTETIHPGNDTPGNNKSGNDIPGSIHRERYDRDQYDRINTTVETHGRVSLQPRPSPSVIGKRRSPFCNGRPIQGLVAHGGIADEPNVRFAIRDEKGGRYNEKQQARPFFKTNFLHNDCG